MPSKRVLSIPAFTPMLTFFWDFAVFGVVVGMAAIGALARFLREYLAAHERAFGAQLLFAAGLWFLVVALRHDTTLVTVWGVICSGRCSRSCGRPGSAESARRSRLRWRAGHSRLDGLRARRYREFSSSTAAGTLYGDAMNTHSLYPATIVVMLAASAAALIAYGSWRTPLPSSSSERSLRRSFSRARSCPSRRCRPPPTTSKRLPVGSFACRGWSSISERGRSGS